MIAQLSKQTEEVDNTDLDQLWAGIRSSEKRSLSQLYCCSYSWLFNYGYKIKPKEHFVEDSIQELFLSLWSKRDYISEAISVKSYLFSSFRRIIFRRLRKKKNRLKRNHDFDQHIFDESYNIEDLIVRFEIKQQQKKQLMLAIESLSKRQREAIYLKFFNGFSNSEIASIMEINKQSVYNHVSKAIIKMQEVVRS